MNFKDGNIRKMEVENNEIVNYFLPIANDKILLNDLIGKEIEIKFEGRINCIKCNQQIKKTFAQGYCYKCFVSSPETEACSISPERCQAHNGIARDLEWANEYCVQDHFVYLSLTSHVKVGVTRQTNIPSRWIDQGAVKAIKLAKPPYRELAGQIEVDLKKYFSDKTSWQKMLKCEITPANLLAEKQKAAGLLRNDLKKYLSPDNTIYEINYPLATPPVSVKSINLDKTPEIKATLIGIKGQYLIFDDNRVLNIRKHNGYFINITTR